MAPASFNTEMAQPRSVRTAGRFFFVISIGITPAKTNPSDRRRVPGA
jgi:hypothetical protein